MGGLDRPDRGGPSLSDLGRRAGGWLPLNRWAGKLFAPVVVNGLGAEAFILDTGAARSSLDQAFAARSRASRAKGRFTGQMIQGQVKGEPTPRICR